MKILKHKQKKIAPYSKDLAELQIASLFFFFSIAKDNTIFNCLLLNCSKQLQTLQKYPHL